MGTDKSRLRLGHRTMLGQIRAEAKRTGLPVRVIRRDLVPHCGPLGGIYTALKTTEAVCVLFLPCDMPFIEGELLKTMKDRAIQIKKPIFTRSEGKAGFPFILPKSALKMVCAQLENRQFSLQNLAKLLNAQIVNPPSRWRIHLQNVNTPADWERALSLCKKSVPKTRV